MQSVQHKDLLSNTVYLLLFCVVVLISTSAVLALNPKSGIQPNTVAGEQVMGISTSGSGEHEYKEPIGILTGMDIQSFEGESGYLSRIRINSINTNDIEQNIVTVENKSNQVKDFKIIFRADPKYSEVFTIWGLVDGYYIPLEFNRNGHIETRFSVSNSQESIIGLRIYSKDQGTIRDIGVEVEVVEL